MTHLTRKRIGYAPGGMMDKVYLNQDIDALDAKLALQSDPNALLEASEEFEAEARQIGDINLLAVVLIQRADILLVKKDFHQAIAVLMDIDRSLTHSTQFDRKVNVYVRLAKAYSSLQDWSSVLAICKNGIAIVEAHRYDVNAQYLAAAYLRSRIGLYSCGVRAAYELKQFDLMLQYAELSKARSVIRVRSSLEPKSDQELQTEKDFLDACEQIDRARVTGQGDALESLLMKRRALWDLLLILRARGKAGAEIPAFDPATVQALLDEDEAVLYYYWLDPEALLIVVVDRDHLKAELTPVPVEQHSKLKELTQSLIYNEINPLDDHFKKQHQLGQVPNYQKLLLPQSIQDSLRSKKRLLISPHGILHALPFQALPWDKEYVFLIQKFAIIYVPNLSCISNRYSPAANPRLLALGLAESHVPGKPYKPLPEAEIEVMSLQQIYNQKGIGAMCLVGAQVSETALRQLAERDEMETFTHLHVSTHGDSVNSDNPMESYLVLSDSYLDGLEIANWRLRAELVVLSACCSGQRAIEGRQMGGKPSELPGDDVFGLQAAFFAAGTKRVLGTLWPVQDALSRKLMVKFYTLLTGSKTPELALQETIVDYLANSKIGYRLPYYWATFFISAVGRPDTS